MKDKQYDPAGQNEKAPAKGMAAVDTHNPRDDAGNNEVSSLKPEEDDRDKVNNLDNDRQ